MQSVISGGLRLASLSLRMALMLFMARYLSFTDIGIFSLMVGTVALLPGAAGLGLSYFVNRDIVGADRKNTYIKARDRLIVTFVCGVISCLGIAALSAFRVLDLTVDLRLFAVVIILEMLGYDLQLLLIARHRAGLANFLLFLRSAAWIPFFILIAFAQPGARNVQILLYVWLTGEVVALGTTFFVLRHVFDKAVITHAFDWKWLRQHFPRVLPIWLSDFSLAVSLNIDRFVISLLVGVEATGIYYFFMAIGGAAFQIVQSAIIQPYMPKMRAFFCNSTIQDFESLVALYLKRVAAVTFATVFFAGIGTLFLILILNRHELSGNILLVFPIMIGIFFRSINEFLGIVDYVMENDLRYMIMNIGMLILTPAILAPSALIYNLMGAAFAFLFIMALFASLRLRIMHKGFGPENKFGLSW